MTGRETSFFLLGMIVSSIYDPQNFWGSVVAKTIVGVMGIIVILAVSERGSK